MQERHSNKEIYFKEQEYTTQKYVIPFVEKHLKVDKNIRVLEIGCGEAGNLKPFVDLGCDSMGVDLNSAKIDHAKDFYAHHPNASVLKLVVEDIYNMVDKFREDFDLIILRDVIEHIHNQEKFMNCLKNFVKPGGKIFFGFPPWQNPFGGHQQICTSKVLSKMPYFHLLPVSLYKAVLSLFGENSGTIKELLEIKETGISIERFERILKKGNWIVDRKTLFFINPNYEVKFGLKPREAFPIISSIPVLRNFFTTACYYLISKK
jgi:2-polyprenyl-3-methyl-5-hydroxy-6-metoxy-1,4-benzoquinol methylase